MLGRWHPLDVRQLDQRLRNLWAAGGEARLGPFPAAIGSLGEWMWVPAVGLLGTYLILLFPDGRLPSGRWRPLAWLSGAVIFSASMGFALSPGPMDGLPGVPNPFGLEKYPWLADATLGVMLLLPLCILASAVSLVLRFLRSRGE